MTGNRLFVLCHFFKSKIKIFIFVGKYIRLNLPHYQTDCCIFKLCSGWALEKV